MSNDNLEYKVIDARSSEDLTKQINELATEGWHPDGNVAASSANLSIPGMAFANPIVTIFVQRLVRERRPE